LISCSTPDLSASDADLQRHSLLFQRRNLELNAAVSILPLALHEFHRASGAVFAEVNGQEVVSDYGDWMAEYAALREGAGVVDMSFRGRLCLVGADRQRTPPRS
jgi:hypothetical protein